VVIPPGIGKENCYTKDMPHQHAGFVERLFLAGSNLLTPLHTALVVAYFVAHAFSGDLLWPVDSFGYLLPWFFIPSLILLPGAILRRARTWIFVAAIPPFLFLLNYGGLFLPRGSATALGPAFKVMTFNVLDLNQEFDAVADEILEHDPDIVGFHELEPAMASALEQRLEDHYPYRELTTGRGLFSRLPIDEYETFQLGQDGHRAQKALLTIGSRQVWLFNVHPRSPRLQGFHPFGLSLGIPTGFDTEDRDRDLTDLLSRLREMEGSLVLMGDMNLSDQQDAYTELARFLLDAHRERGWGLGLTLAFWRIDFIFYTPDLVTLNSETGDFSGSDHRPVIAQLSFGEASGLATDQTEKD
jgi:endonuclease/exonuclease/phosphatase (EEP) superfamily protein YafD